MVFHVHFDAAVVGVKVQLGSDHERQYFNSVSREPELLRLIYFRIALSCLCSAAAVNSRSITLPTLMGLQSGVPPGVDAGHLITGTRSAALPM